VHPSQVFLRLLEYYSGILFLTTNRVGTLDPALESRIDMAFHYPALDITGRATVLRNLLATLPADSVEALSDDEVAELMREPLNGRHIKSAVKTAYILANSDGSRVNKEHLNQVLEIRKKTRAFLRSEDCL
jgi:AAA+ superfamily predicted ATPase